MNYSRARRRGTTNAIVRATCGSCGDVELVAEQVQIQVCVSVGTSTYSFICPCCCLIVNKEATGPVVESLTAAGSPLVAWTLPGELNEPKIGPRINHDDLLEFHLALESGNWHEELALLAPKG